MRRTAVLPIVATFATVALASGCVESPPSDGWNPAPSTAVPPSEPTTTVATTLPTTTTTTTTLPSNPNGPSEAPGPNLTGVVAPVGELSEIRTGIGDTPWDIVRLDSGSTFISRRDAGTISELTAEGELRTVSVVSNVTTGGHGVLGLAVLAGSGATPSYLYYFHTTATDNRISRAAILGDPGSYSLGTAEVVFSGLQRGNHHSGGRLAFGLDGMLYVSSSDAFVPNNAQNLSNYAGKILRITPTGLVPADNPFTGSAIWSYGHRNVQGLAFDAQGRLWASEFGNSTADELNLIERGGNYGWPVREGTTGAALEGAIDPVATWPVAEASPAGVAIVGDTVFVAALKGQRLLAVDVSATPAVTTSHFVGEIGRIREVATGPGNTLWLTTSNGDGFGSLRNGDERLVQVQIG